MERQPQEISDRLDSGDEPRFSWGPLVVTTNEIHALQLGVVGLFTGLAYSAGLVNESLSLTGLLVLTVFGLRAIPGEVNGGEVPIAVRTKRHEPWWFISSYSITFMVGAVVGGIV